MYQVGEYVVHPGQGVCRVEDVTQGATATYQLLPMGQPRPMHISYPVASESRLRPILTRAEARSVIENYPQMDLDGFSDRSVALEEEHYKKEIRNGSCQDSVRVVKTITAKIAAAQEKNKKAPVAYERILKQARARSLEELSCALDCSQEDVIALFEETNK